MAQALEKVLIKDHIPHILARHLQIDADPVPGPALHFDADPNRTDFFLDADPDFYLMRIRIFI